MLKILTFYKYHFSINFHDKKEIVLINDNDQLIYDNIWSFIHHEIFYQKIKNFDIFHSFENGLFDFDTSPIDIINNNSSLKYLLNQPIFNKIYVNLHNYGTFFRIPENKAQKNYVNFTFNGGIMYRIDDKYNLKNLINVIENKQLNNKYK
jgi:hypothetical protein